MTATLDTKYIKENNQRFSPEIELLLYCSRTRLTPEIAQKITDAIAQNDIDWQQLLTTAAQHGLIPLLFNSLQNIKFQSVPTGVRSSLQYYFQSIVRQNLLLTSELLKILTLLKENQIKAIPFKGASLAARAYGQITLRQFCDLDILVEEKNAKKIVDLLVSIGYELPDPIGDLQRRPYMAHKLFLESEATQKKYNLVHSQKKVAIDLQWSLAERRITNFFPVDFQHLYNNSQTTLLGNTEIRQFSQEDTLLYLCFHGSKHCWSELKWICDVAEFVAANPELDWSLVRERAKKWKVSRMLNLGLLLAIDLLDLELPKSVAENMAVDRTIERLSDRVKQSIFERPLKETEKIAFRFKLRSQLSEQIVYFLDVLFTPTGKEWKYVELPKPLIFMYRFVRPYRLLREFAIDKNKKQVSIQSDKN